LKLHTFFEKFDLFADAPGAVVKMRELVLDLAIQGKLVERKASDGDGHSLLKRLRTLPPEQNSKSRSPKDITVEPTTPLEIPTHWALTTVDNTTRETGFFCDGDWVESKDQDPDGDVRLVQLADVGDGEYRDRSSRFMTKAAAERLNCSYLEPGDILVARMPDPLGRCCRFPGDSKPAVTVVDVCILRPNVTFFDPDFLIVAMNCPRFRVLVSAQATGTTRSRISRSNLGVLPVPLPPLAEQKRIVAKVDELMALCDRLEAQQQERETRHAALTRASLARFADAPTPANLDFLFHSSFSIQPSDLRKSILTLAVQGKLVPQEPNDEPTEYSEYDAPFEIPAGWEWKALGSVGICRTGKTPPTSDPTNYGNGFPFIGPGQITPSGNFTLSEKTITHSGLANGTEARSSDILMVCIGGSIGKAAICRETLGFNQQINSIRLTRDVPEFLYLALTSSYFQEQVVAKATGSATPIINKGKWEQIPIPIPPLAEQRRIVAKVDQLMALVDQLEAQLAASRATAANLLDALVAELTAA
jgi:type I restriction enzyme S subunit